MSIRIISFDHECNIIFFHYFACWFSLIVIYVEHMIPISIILAEPMTGNSASVNRYPKI